MSDKSKPRHEILITPRGVKAHITWSPLRRALLIHVTIDGNRQFSLSVDLGDLLVSLGVTENTVLGRMALARSFRHRNDRPTAQEEEDAA